MDNNIYASPESDVVDNSDGKSNLASRWKRFWASLLDGLTISVVTVPVMYFTGGFDGISTGAQPSLEYSLMVGVLGLVVFFAINTKLLINSGQTIGKKVLGIKIVDLEGKLPTLKDLILKRYSVYFIPGQIPVGGPIFSLLNILFIFGKQRRCIHDYAAGTKVVVA